MIEPHLIEIKTFPSQKGILSTIDSKNNLPFEIRRISKFSSFNFMKLLSINVKNVKKAREIVKTNIIIINKFLFNNANII